MESDKKGRFSELSKALGHPHRAEIINILANLPCDSQCMVGNIVDRLPISQSTVSTSKNIKRCWMDKRKYRGPQGLLLLREGSFKDYKRMFISLFTDMEWDILL